MTVDNSTILASASLVGTSDYQQFMNKLSQSTTRQVVDNLFDVSNRIYYNQFLDVLVNRIGATYVKRHQFDNPLAVFKRANLNYGNSIQLIATDYIRTQEYRDSEPQRTEDGDTVFSTYRPQGVKAAYVSTNQFRQYPITINQQLLRQAFASETGLNDFIAQIMSTPMNSDAYAEYRAMCNSIAEFDKANKGLIYRHKAYNAVPNDAEGAKQFLKDLRAYAYKMKFPNLVRQYIPADVPATYDVDELVLLVTPDVLSSLDVDGLAQLFNLEKAEWNYRTIVIDNLGIQNCFAALVSERTLLAMDTIYENGSFYNPKTLSQSWFLTHCQIAGVCDPFEPIVLFGYDAEIWNATTPKIITETVESIAVTSSTATVKRGDTLQLYVALNGTLTVDPSTDTVPDAITVAPDSATFTVTAKDNAGAAILLNSRTYVDPRTNLLHTQKTGLKTGDVLTVTATGTYANPTSSEEQTPFTSTLDITIA